MPSFPAVDSGCLSSRDLESWKNMKKQFNLHVLPTKKNIGNPPQTNPAAKWLKIIFQIFRFVSRRVILKSLKLGGWVSCGNYMKRHDVDFWRAKETQTIPTFERRRKLGCGGVLILKYFRRHFPLTFARRVFTFARHHCCHRLSRPLSP